MRPPVNARAVSRSAYIRIYIYIYIHIYICTHTHTHTRTHTLLQVRGYAPSCISASSLSLHFHAALSLGSDAVRRFIGERSPEHTLDGSFVGEDSGRRASGGAAEGGGGGVLMWWAPLVKILKSPLAAELTM